MQHIQQKHSTMGNSKVKSSNVSWTGNNNSECVWIITTRKEYETKTKKIKGVSKSLNDVCEIVKWAYYIFS